MASDLRRTVVALLRTPGFTLAAVLTLAVGISTNAAIFGIVDAVLLRPLPFHDADQLVRITSDLTKRGTHDVGIDIPFLDDLTGMTDVFDGVSGVFAVNDNLTEVTDPERIEGELVSTSYFSLLGVDAAIGRVFGPDDDPSRAQLAVISQALWRRRFGADLHVIGRVIRLDADPATIIGVLPASFRHPAANLADDTDVFLATTFRDPSFGPITRGRFRIGGAIARLKPGISLKQAQARLAVAGAALAAEHPDAYPPAIGWTPRLTSLQDDLVGGVRRTLVVLFVAVGALLLIACANVAGLLIARSASRQREWAIRAALGASRARLIRYGLVEGLVIAAGGCFVSLVVTRGLLEALVALYPSRLPRAIEIGVDWRVFTFAAALAVVTGVLFSLWPAIQSSRTDPQEILRSGGRSLTADPVRARARRLVVVAELAASVILLVVAALFARSLLALSRVDPGFRSDGVLTARLWMALSNDNNSPYRSRDNAVALLRRATERLEALPGVTRAAWTNALPFSGGHADMGFLIEGWPESSSLVTAAEPARVTPAYFEVLGIPLVRGRVFSDADIDTAPPVMIVSESVAHRYFPSGEAIGIRVRPGGPTSTAPWFTIVGIVGDVRSVSLDAAPGAQMYRCAWQSPDLSMTLVVRTAADPAAMVEPIRRTVAAVDPNVPLFRVEPMDALLESSIADRRFALRLVGVFAVIALLLASTGVYGVVAHAVAQRSSEIGLRLALGASWRDVVWMVLREGLALVGTGVVIGAAGAYVAARLVQNFLFGVHAADPLTYVGVALVLAVVGVAACVVPARRAAAIDPIAAMREA